MLNLPILEYSKSFQLFNLLFLSIAFCRFHHTDPVYVLLDLYLLSILFSLK